MPDVPVSSREDVCVSWVCCVACEDGHHEQCIGRLLIEGVPGDCDCKMLGHILDRER